MFFYWYKDQSPIRLMPPSVHIRLYARSYLDSCKLFNMLCIYVTMAYLMSTTSPGNLVTFFTQLGTNCNIIFFATVSFYEDAEHHTKSPKKSRYGKALNLHNPKWPPNFNNVLYRVP